MTPVSLDEGTIVCGEPVQLIETDKVVCESRCGWRGRGHEMLRAPNPFDPEDELIGCPRCKQPNTLLQACDAPGCWCESSCGTPTPEGYRRTCCEHWPRRHAA